MYVYRVEHNNKDYDRGPYTSGVAYQMRLFDEDHPSPEQSGIQMTPEYYSCFANEKDLTKWFRNSERTFFKEFGYETYRYEVSPSHVQLGDKQAAFKRDKAYKRQKVTVH